MPGLLDSTEHLNHQRKLEFDLILFYCCTFISMCTIFSGDLSVFGGSSVSKMLD